MSANEKVFSVLLAPRVSEKTARLQEVSNQYVFEVSNDATKPRSRSRWSSCSTSRSSRSTSST